MEEGQLASLRSAVGVSAAAAKLMRRGAAVNGIRRRAQGYCERRGEAALPRTALVAELLESYAVDRKLGSGTYGSVFSGKWKKKPAALKFIAFVPSSLGGLGTPLHELQINRSFAKHGLAWEPLGLSDKKVARGLRASENPDEAARANVSVLGLRLLPETLDVALSRDPSLRRRDLGLVLSALVRSALDHGLVHGDAKANNIGVDRLGDVAGFVDLRYIDFGRSLSAADLEKRLSKEDAAEVLRIAAASDALRLAESCRRLLRKHSEPAAEDIVAPLERFASSLLRAGEDPDVDALNKSVRRMLQGGRVAEK